MGGGEPFKVPPVVIFPDLFTSAHKDCPMPQGTDPLNPDLPSSHPPTVAPDHVTGKVTGPTRSPPLPLPRPWFLGWSLQHPTGSWNCPISPRWLRPVGSEPISLVCIWVKV